MSKILEPKFRLHRDCEALTELTLSHLPTEGSLGRARRCRKDCSVWRSDDLANSVYFLRHGQIKVVADGADGREVVLRMVRPGQIFGELCFCSGKKSFRLSSAVAIVDSEVLEIELSHFLAYMQNNLPTLASFVFTFCKLLSDSHHRIEILACRGADERLGKLLLQLATSRGGRSKQKGGKISLTLSHAELAQMAAMSRPHVSVTMGNFRRRGLVQYRRNRPLLVDVQSLSAYVTSHGTP